jgi:hypothetical protein
MPSGLAAVFALKSKLSHDIAFYGDYFMIWIILRIGVAISAIAGIKRTAEPENLSFKQDGTADSESTP